MVPKDYQVNDPPVSGLEIDLDYAILDIERINEARHVS